jgi:methyl-accepting chemotaxis protein
MLESRHGSLHKNIELLFWVDLEGVSWSSAGLRIDLNERAYVKNILRDGKDHVMSDPVISKTTGLPIIVIAHAVRDDKKVLRGIMAATVTLDALTALASNVKIGKDGFGWLTDGTGLALAHPDEKLRMKFNALQADAQGYQGLTVAASNMIKGNNDATVIVRPDGSELYLAYAPVPGTPSWSFGIMVPMAQIRGPLQSILMAMLVLAISIIILTTLAVWVIAASITRGVMRHAETMLESANYVHASSEQLAQASQGLASGSSEQAASIEEISASLEEISGMTKQNADNASQADKLTHAALRSIENAHQSMKKSLTASQEIAQASSETQKIIKTIDEIAFQTNLLSLNAAVEAARAGEAGAGFAVVADEVRSLSMRSAEASRRTAGLIEETIKRVNDGVEIFAESGRAIDEVVEQSGKVQQLVSEIAAASVEQSKGIEQINRGVVEMEKVVQQTAANAEETASSSEELSAQAEEMNSTVDRLVGFIGGAGKKLTSNVKNKSQIKQRQAGSSGKSVGVNKKNQDLTVVKSAQKTAVKSSHEINPEQIIPLDDEDLKDF